MAAAAGAAPPRVALRAQLHRRAPLRRLHGAEAQVRYALVDIDGTLTSSAGAIPGAVGAFSRLRASVAGLQLVTNQSQESSARTAARVRGLGFDLRAGEVFSAVAAARQVVLRERLRPLYLLTDAAMEEFEGIPAHEPNAVVVGTAPGELHYERLTRAMRALQSDERSMLIAVNKGRYFARDDGLAMMAGPFVAALEFATGRAAVVCGKPEPGFFAGGARAAAGNGSTPAPRSCVMIGDDARDDVQGAMDAGMQAILVRTGKYRAGDEAVLRSPPLGVVDDFASAVELLLAQGILCGEPEGAAQSA